MANNLFLNWDWFLLLNDEGYFNGEYFEGAMGYILQLQNKTDKNNIRALKIPRLISDSQKENSYISQMLKDEGESLFRINPTAVPTPGLLFGDINFNNIFRAPVHFPGDAQDEQIIGIQLRKDMPPRFCGLKKTKKGVQFFPKKLKELTFFNPELINKIIEEGKSGGSKWVNTVVYEHRDTHKITFGYDKEGNPEPFYIEKALIVDYSEDYWYFGIPAVVYGWGLGTLEDAIKSNKIKNWGLEEYLKLLLNILSGLSRLHNNEFIHADIRPANIMYFENVQSPDKYHLIDYAGYNTAKNVLYFLRKPQADIGHAHGYTLIGASIGRERNSPFYSPERRIAIENEDANIAIFIKENNDSMLIFLGWREECIQDNKVKSKLIDTIKRCKIQEKISYERDSLSKYMEDELQSGDRLQIREYIFDVEGIGQIQEYKIYKCRMQHWKIFQSHIVIKDEEKFFDDVPIKFFSISKYVKLKQWSVSTEMYSIGALFLYLIYYGKNNIKESYKTFTDPEFRRLLIEFENVQFFQEIWSELATLCLNFNKIPLAGVTKEEIEERMIDLNIYKTRLELESTKNNKTINLISYSKYVTRLITSTIEGTRKLYSNLNYNHVHFIYCMCFILCCLHKRIEIPENLLTNFIHKNDIYCLIDDKETEKIVKDIFNKYKDIFLILPFTSNRTSSPRENIISAANLCKNFLRNFLKFVQATTFEKFISDFNIEKETDNLSTPLILKSRNQYLEDKIEYILNKIEDAKGKCGLGNKKIKIELNNIIEFINE